MEVLHNREQRQFEIREGTLLARLSYKLSGGEIDLIHTEVPRELGGQGLGNQLAAAALEFAAQETLRVVPTCPFVRSYLERHPHYAKLTQRSAE
jgi:predicted GNAT family acetyltransferase